jgi:hypothetical protein
VEAPFVDVEIVKVNGDTELERLQVQDIQATVSVTLTSFPSDTDKAATGNTFTAWCVLLTGHHVLCATNRTRFSRSGGKRYPDAKRYS